MTNGRRLTRSRNKMIAGVCAGIAEYFGWEVTLFRVVFVLVPSCRVGISRGSWSTFVLLGHDAAGRTSAIAVPAAAR